MDGIPEKETFEQLKEILAKYKKTKKYHIWNWRKYLVVDLAKRHKWREIWRISVKSLLLRKYYSHVWSTIIHSLSVPNLRIASLYWFCTRQKCQRSIWLVRRAQSIDVWFVAQFHYRTRSLCWKHCAQRVFQTQVHWQEPLLRLNSMWWTTDDRSMMNNDDRCRNHVMFNDDVRVSLKTKWIRTINMKMIHQWQRRKKQ